MTDPAFSHRSKGAEGTPRLAHHEAKKLVLLSVFNVHVCNVHYTKSMHKPTHFSKGASCSGLAQINYNCLSQLHKTRAYEMNENFQVSLEIISVLFLLHASAPLSTLMSLESGCWGRNRFCERASKVIELQQVTVLNFPVVEQFLFSLFQSLC